MDQNLYDEFGNYIGPELSYDDAEEEDIELEEEGGQSIKDAEMEEVAVPSSAAVEETEPLAVVPHEEKQYYPEAAAVYPGVETLMEDEDTQPLTEPIIAQVKTKNFDWLEAEMPVTTFAFEFMTSLMYKPEMIRNVCLLGHLSHGKTSVMDLLVHATHTSPFCSRTDMRYTDSRLDERQRGLSIKAVPMSLILPDHRQKSYLINCFDAPGHVNFSDECTAAIRLSDGAAIVVDGMEGVMVGTDRLLRHAVREKLQICLIINAVDRIILELRIPPADMYHKLRHTIEEVNTILESECSVLGRSTIRVSPLLGNVAFSSGTLGGVFTLKSFARLYAQNHPDIDVEKFASCLWGDVFFNADPKVRNFTKKPQGDVPRSFVHFILEPLYKITAHTVAEEKPSLEPTLKEIGVYLRKEEFRLSTRQLMQRVWTLLLGDVSALVEMFVECVPSPVEAAGDKMSHIYSGDLWGEAARSMRELDKNGTLMVHTAKNFHRPDCTTFDSFGRVMSGTLAKGQKVRVLGEAFSLDDDEDATIREITSLWIFEARYRVEVSHVPPGVWVLIGGLDPFVRNTSTITSVNAEAEIFRPLRFHTTPVMRVAAEPWNPSDLPKMLEGLRKVDRAYPAARTKVEESGEHVVFGSGELYMDCILHDLRKLYGDLEIKVSDPGVQFCETIVETSAFRSFSVTPNQKNKIYMSVEPLEQGLGLDIEKELLDLNWNQKRLSSYLETNYAWDVLATRSLWAFGPDNHGPNVLLCDVLAEENRNAVTSIRDSIVRGFQWATREGPLIEEPIRNCKFKILDASVATDPISRAPGQIIPTARRVAYSSFLLATPRLLEPMLFAEIVCPADCVAAVYTVLARRRGHVSRDVPKPGTPLYIVHAYIPAIESFGFETDLRTHTSGQAFGMTVFDSWSLVPGDPLDKSIILRPLEPAPVPHLAREFLLKTRRRKGLSEDVSIQKFFDDPMLIALAQKEADLQHYF